MLKRIVLLTCLALLSAPVAMAELLEVQVGGEVSLRARGYINSYTDGAAREVRIPADMLPRRATGEAAGVTSNLKWNSEGSDRFYAEGVTRLNVNARFTEQVSTFTELYSYWFWGDGFRSDYATGLDFRGGQNDGTQILQAYVELEEVLDQPLRLRIGRQLLRLGNGWLVGEKTTATQYLSHDAVRLTYTPTDWEVDAFWSRIAEDSFGADPGDGDFLGLYGTYKGFENINLSAYYLFLKDHQRVEDFRGTPVTQWAESLVGIDQYPKTTIHTLGARIYGDIGSFDYSVEGAYQWGDAATVGQRFQRDMLWGSYGDNRAEYDNWGAEAEIGYRVDMIGSPRFYAGGVYFGGEDNRDVSFWEWLNPFSRPQASVSFNRLFSQTYHSPVLVDNTHMSNFSQLRLGVQFKPADAWSVNVRAANYWANGAFEYPRRLLGSPLAPTLSFWTEQSSRDLGTTVETIIGYQYSEDLRFSLYWGHLFTGKGLTRDGNYIYMNGLGYSGGTGNSDAGYITFLTTVTF